MESFESQTPVVDNQQETSKPTLRPALVWVLLSLLLSGGIGLWRLLTSGNEPPSSAAALDYPSSCRDNSDYSRRGGETHYWVRLKLVKANRTHPDGWLSAAGLVQSGDRVTPGTTIAILMMRISSWQ